MKALRYRMHLLEPVLVSEAGAGEENSAIGFSYIPGSALRGALASRWLAEHSGVDMAADPAARPDSAAAGPTHRRRVRVAECDACSARHGGCPRLN